MGLGVFYISLLFARHILPVVSVSTSQSEKIKNLHCVYCCPPQQIILDMYPNDPCFWFDTHYVILVLWIHAVKSLYEWQFKTSTTFTLELGTCDLRTWTCKRLVMSMWCKFNQILFIQFMSIHVHVSPLTFFMLFYSHLQTSDWMSAPPPLKWLTMSITPELFELLNKSELSCDSEDRNQTGPPQPLLSICTVMSTWHVWLHTVWIWCWRPLV